VIPVLIHVQSIRESCKARLHQWNECRHPAMSFVPGAKMASCTSSLRTYKTPLLPSRSPHTEMGRERVQGLRLWHSNVQTASMQLAPSLQQHHMLPSVPPPLSTRFKNSGDPATRALVTGARSPRRQISATG
jgi:hypothetical protein